jgi:nucleoside-diphosphate-sugar epimerase
MSTVFVTGATGVIGRATVPRLIAAGYTVRALSRSAANDDAIRAMGAEPSRGDLFDADALAQAVDGVDAVMHLATHIPASSEVRKPEAWAENDRIRAIGAKMLVDAALKTGVKVFVYPSFAFVYPDSGDRWIHAESTPPAPADNLHSTITAEREVRRFAESEPTSGRRGVALRLGGLYGPDVPSFEEQLALARRGISMFGAAPDAFTPMLWIGDAATALVAALERAPSGVYNVVDDEPLRQRELNRALAAAVGKRRLLSLPRWLIRLAAGPGVAVMLRSLRISNRRFREATGWEPSVPSAIDGLQRVAATTPPRPSPRVPFSVRAGLWAIALITLGAGVWQQFAPRSFYDAFPGLGRHWVSVDGPFNEHLLRDLGGANLALGVIAVYAIARPSVGLVRALAAALLVSQVPHFLYHLAHLGALATPLDRALQTAALTLTLAVPVLILVGSKGMAETLEMPAKERPLPTETGKREPRLIKSAGHAPS